MVVTPGDLLFVKLLPEIYPPLFMIYALYNQADDERYYRKLVLWNRQSDLALFSQLEINQ